MSDQPTDESDVDPAKDDAAPAESAETKSVEKADDSSATKITPEATTNAVPSRRSRFAGLKWLGKTLVHAGVLAAVFVGGIALIGVAQRTGWIRSGDGTVADSADEHNHDGETIYTCPMHPHIRQNTPGKCSICAMTLVPVADKSKKTASNQPATKEGEDRYICPMMCTPPSTQEGRCPVCAM